MLLADEFFLLALDDRSGRPMLSPRVMGLGLAGGLLGELMLEQRIRIRDNRVQLVDRHPPDDEVTGWTFRQLAAEAAQHEIRTWLVYLAQHSRDLVSGRLRRGGHIGEQTVRRLWRREVIYPPVDMNAVAVPRARLADALTRRLPMSWPDVTLAGLTVATGLDGHVLYAAGPAARPYLRHLIDHLPSAVHELVWHLHAAVGDAVMTGRT